MDRRSDLTADAAAGPDETCTSMLLGSVTNPPDRCGC
jgi:hypothetical protein